MDTCTEESHKIVIKNKNEYDNKQPPSMPTIIKEKRKYKKNPKIPKTCEVCGRISMFKYYNVQSCDGCKQFFRRSIVAGRTFSCRERNMCFINEDTTTGCRACRFDKCLLVGMDPTLVETENSRSLYHFIQSLNLRRKFLQANKNETPQAGNALLNENDGLGSVKLSAADDTFHDCQSVALSPLAQQIPANLSEKNVAIYQTICKMALVEQQIRTFLGIRLDFYDGIFDHFSTLCDFLNEAENIICNLQKYATKSLIVFKETKGQYGDPEPVYKAVAKTGNFGGCKNIFLTFEIVTVIDLFRTMPHFEMLESTDKAILLNFVAIPLIELSDRFYSSKTNSPFVKVIPSCEFSPFFLYHNNPYYGGDKTVETLSEAMYLRSMDAFNRLRLSDEEFLMLRALMLSNPAISSLSDTGRHILQHLSEHYADILMHHLRTKFGCTDGARRFADLINLTQTVIYSAKRHRDLFTYLAMVTDQGRFHNAMPAIFMPMVLYGTE